MTLFKSSFWMGLSTAIKALMTYVMWKIIAVRVGPAGIAIIEQFQNFIQLSRVAVPAGINEGVIKYGSEYRDDSFKKSGILTNALFINFIIFLISFFALIFFSHQFSEMLFQSDAYSREIILVAFGVILFIANSFCLSMLNAEMEIKKYFVSTVSATILNFALTTFLVIKLGLSGALVGFALNQTVICFLSIYLVIKSRWFRFQLFFSKINFSYIRKLVRYSFIPYSSALLVPVAYILTTKYVVSMLTWTDAGYWQALMRLSTAYLTVMAMIFGFYFIPKFSSLKTQVELKKEVIKSHYAIVPLIFLCASLVFIFKKQILTVMYSTAFLPALPLFKYQLLGDVARACTWLLKNILVARALVKASIIFEVIFTISYVVLTILFVHFYGLIGTAIAFAINYIAYWIAMIVFSSQYLKS